MGDERGVSRVTNVNLTGLEVANNVLVQLAIDLELGSTEINGSTYLAAEAVPNSADLLHAESLANILDCRLNDRFDISDLVPGEPGGQVDLASFEIANADLVALEKIREDGQVAIVGELVSEKLGVGKDAEDVGQEDNGLVGVLVVLGGGDVGVD